MRKKITKPTSIDENDKRNRRRFFDVIESVHRKNRDVAPEQIDAAIQQAIEEVRKSKRRR